MNYEIPDCDVEELGHTSEIGLRASAPTQSDLFRCLACAVIALSGVEAEPEEEPQFYEVDLTAGDLESLMVDWLNEILYLHEAYGLVVDDVEVEEITPQMIRATVLGRRAGRAPDLQIKAVTYHQLKIGHKGEGWMAEVFFDI
jgi:SHS2 domain-containing protein